MVNKKTKLPDLNYKNDPQLVALRERASAIRARLVSPDNALTEARRTLAEAKRVYDTADVALLTGQGTAAELKAASDKLTEARLAFESARTDADAASAGVGALEVALCEVNTQIERIEGEGRLDAREKFKPHYAAAVRDVLAALEALNEANKRLSEVYQHGRHVVVDAWPGPLWAYPSAAPDDVAKWYKRRAEEAGLL